MPKKKIHYIHIDIDPVAKGRPRFSRKTMVAYTPAKTREFEKKFKLLALNQYEGRPLRGALQVKIVLNIRKPKTVKRKYVTVKPDCTNYAKGVEDALNGVMWLDDSQIVDLRVIKQYADYGSIEVFANELV